MSRMSVLSLQAPKVRANTYSKTIAWPVYMWRAVIPEQVMGELDILERLVLSLANIDKLSNATIFNELNMSKELIQTVIKRCQDADYLKGNTLTDSGKQMLADEPMLEQQMIKNYEQIYLFQDGLSGDLVPHFDVATLPSFTWVECHLKLDGKRAIIKKPHFVEMESSLRNARFIRKMIEEQQHERGVEEIQPEESFIDEQLMQFMDELHEEGPLTLAEAEEQEAIEESTRSIITQGMIKVLDDKPELIYMPVVVYAHVDTFMNGQIYAHSPFSVFENDWFTQKLLYAIQNDETVALFIDILKEEMQKEFMDRYPFHNYLDIELFKQFPLIANDEKWKSLREQIEAMEIAYSRIANGDEDYDNFYMRAQRTIESVLYYTVCQLPNLSRTMQFVERDNYKDTLMAAEDFLTISIPRNYYGLEFCSRLQEITRNVKRSKSSKDRALLLVIDASKNKNEASISVFRDMPDFLKRINFIVNSRNQTAHFNEQQLNHLDIYKNIKSDTDAILTMCIAKFLTAKGAL